METPNSGCPTWLINVYGAVLYLYPTSFRENYREQMLQVFTDNYRRRQKTNAALFYFDTISDLGNSMSQEHFSDFSKNGRIRMAVIGLCLAFGLLALRPFLINSLTDGFVLMANVDQAVNMRLYSDYLEHRLEISQELLISDEPISVIAGAQSYSDLRFDTNLKTKNSVNIKEQVAQALRTATNDSRVWLAAYYIYAQKIPTYATKKKYSLICKSWHPKMA